MEIWSLNFALISPTLGSFGLVFGKDCEVIVVNLGTEVSFIFAFTLHSKSTISLELRSELSKLLYRNQLCYRAGVGLGSEVLKVSGILVHRDVNDSLQDGKDLVVCIKTILKLYVLVPEWMSQEVEADSNTTSLK